MPQAARSEESENARIVLGLLESVERDGAQSQRKLAFNVRGGKAAQDQILRRDYSSAFDPD